MERAPKQHKMNVMGMALRRPPEQTDVTRMGGMLHDTRDEEECCLVGGVVEQLQRILIGRLQAVEHRDQTESRKSGAGQDRLQVGFLQGLVGREGECDETDRRQEGCPGRHFAEDGQHPPHEEDARLDHGC